WNSQAAQCFEKLVVRLRFPIVVVGVQQHGVGELASPDKRPDEARERAFATSEPGMLLEDMPGKRPLVLDAGADTDAATGHAVDQRQSGARDVAACKQEHAHNKTDQ